MKLGGCVYMQALVRVNEVNDDVMQYVEGRSHRGICGCLVADVRQVYQVGL